MTVHLTLSGDERETEVILRAVGLVLELSNSDHAHERPNGGASRYADAQLRLPYANVPSTLIAHLAAAWPDRQTVSNVFDVTTEQAQQRPDLLGHVEREVRTALVRGAADRGLVLLTETGPLWTYRPGFVRTPGTEPGKREQPWQRTDPVPNRLGYLICRIHADAIPPMPKESGRV